MSYWYTDAIKAKWNDPRVQKLILELIDAVGDWDEPDDEPRFNQLPKLELAVFGARVAHECGSLNLPGAPICWGCEQEITREERE